MKYNSLLLNEGARDNMLAVYLPLFQKRGIDMDVSKLKQLLLYKFTSEGGLRKLSERSNYYLAGAARYYFNGDLTTNKKLNALYPNVKDRFNEEVCTRLNALIGILRDAYIDSVGTQFEQPEDFGTLSIKQLFRKYGKKINMALGITGKEEKEAPQIDEDTTAGKNYTYDILYSHEDAKKYYKYTEPGAWCITYGQQHYDYYIRALRGIHYIVFARKGFEKVPRRMGPNFTKRKPHDEYGNSLICVLQKNNSPEPTFITSRWNHGSPVDGTSGIEADHAYTKEEFLNVIGCDESVLKKAFDQWNYHKPKEEQTDRKTLNAEKRQALRNFKYIQMLLNGGTQLSQIPKQLLSTGNYIIKNEKKPDDSLMKIGTIIGSKFFYTIMDRRQIKFNDILFNGDQWLNIHKPSDTGGERFVKMRLNGDYHYIYDLKYHRFIEVDGEKKFKYCGDEAEYAYPRTKYTVVGTNSRRWALVDLETGKPVKTRTGAVWFEGIVGADSWSDFNGYSNRYMSPPSLNWNNFLRLTYDSSANIWFLFSTKTGKFVDLETTDDGFAPNKSQQERRTDYVYYTNSSTYGTYIYKFKNLFTNEWLNIGGQTIFKYRPGIDRIGDKELWSLTFLNGEDILWFKNTNKILSINGQVITGVNSYHIETRGGYFAFPVPPSFQVDNKYEECKMYLLFNPQTGEFYHDDINGYFIPIRRFMRTISCPSGIQALDRNGNVYTIPKAEDEVPQQEANRQVGESYKNKFNSILECLNRRF